MTATPTDDTLRLGIPKGRMFDGITKLLGEAGVSIKPTARGYRPTTNLHNAQAKILKPQNIVTMLASGSRDCGFAGADWVAELAPETAKLDFEPVEILDLRLDPVRIVAAAPRDLLVSGRLPNPPGGSPLRVAGEMERLATQWIERSGLNARFVRTYGATEVFPPEDADCIIDITQTGATLEANNLHIVDTLMESSTRFFASSGAMDNPAKRERIENLAMLLEAALTARRRVMVEMNVAADQLAGLIDVIPCMREPTVSPLHGTALSGDEGQITGYAVKIAAPKDDLPRLIPSIKAAGGTDIVITKVQQVIP